MFCSDIMRKHFGIYKARYKAMDINLFPFNTKRFSAAASCKGTFLNTHDIQAIIHAYCIRRLKCLNFSYAMLLLLGLKLQVSIGHDIIMMAIAG